MAGPVAINSRTERGAGASGRWRGVLTWIAFVGVAFAARSSLADHYHVPTGSMIPTVAVGDRVVVNKVAYDLRVPFTDVRMARLGDPHRGEVVVLRSPEEQDVVLLKRVAAVPGDVVAVRGGRLWLNGATVPIEGGDDAVEVLAMHPHAIRLDAGGGPSFGPVQLSEDEYLVLGDNRGDSHDGRDFGPVKRGAFLGRAIAVFAHDGRPVWRPF